MGWLRIPSGSHFCCVLQYREWSPGRIQTEGRKPPFFVNNVEASFAGRCVILLGMPHKITFFLPFPQCGLTRAIPQLDGSSADTSRITTEKVNVTSLTAGSRFMIGSARTLPRKWLGAN